MSCSFLLLKYRENEGYLLANDLTQGVHMELKQIRVPSLSKITNDTFDLPDVVDTLLLGIALLRSKT